MASRSELAKKSKRAVSAARNDIRRSDTIHAMSSLPLSVSQGQQMKADPELLRKLKDITTQLQHLSGDPGTYELDIDAVVDLNLARESVDKLINRVERILE